MFNSMASDPGQSDKPNRLEKLFQRLFPKSEQLVKNTITERRSAYRLELGQTSPVPVQLELYDRSIFKTDLGNLSAGGFSCLTPSKINLGVGDKVRFSFDLKMEDDYRIHHFAQVMGQSAKTNRSEYRFKFDSSFPTPDGDLIHRFILKKQLEQIRGN